VEEQMKSKILFRFYLFYPTGITSLLRNGWIIIALLLCSTITTAQAQTPSDEFTVGSPIHRLEDFPVLFDVFDTTGFNTIAQRADYYTIDLPEKYNLIAVNIEKKTEYIAHYTTAYYSKWEAEQNQEDSARIGMKHYDSRGNTFGEVAYWNDGSDSVLCWSTKGLSAPACSLMYGPHYRQDKRYKRWNYQDCYNEPGCVTYTPRFRMALDNPTDVEDDEDVCILKVVFRWREKDADIHHDTIFLERTLKVGDFDTTGKFDDFYLHPDPEDAWYDYAPDFILPKDFALMEGSSSSVDYVDWESYTGIQFWVDWLRTDTLCNLYIDYAEVYDNDGWNEYIELPGLVEDQIISYADSFNTMEWDNIIYWGGVDEPYSIDCYTPIRVVDSLIQSVQAPPLIVHFDPTWWHTFKVNGEDEIAVFDSIAKPEKIMLGLYPCSPNWPAIRKQDFDWLTFNFQRTSIHDSSFWFKPQTFGFRTNYNFPNDPPEWCVWRKPDPPELTSMTMLALAHGAKGILFEWFDSYELTAYSDCAPAYIECLVDSNGTPEVNDGDTLYFTVKNNLVPRLKGKLGKRLMNLDYTGDYISLYCNGCPNHDSPTIGYLTLDCEATNYFWHCGFFDHKGLLR